MAHTLKEIYSKLVDAKLRKTHPILTNGIFNTKYEGDINAGAIKIPVRDGEVVVGAYSKVNGKAITQGSTSYITLPLNNDEAVNEMIDGVDANALSDNLIADRLESASYSIGNSIESYLTSILEAQGQTMSNTTQSTSSTAYSNVVEAKTNLTKASVPNDKRWILVSPEFHALLLEDTKFIKATETSQGMLMAGAIGQIAGLQVFEDNELDANTEFIVGHSQNANYASGWKTNISITNLTNEFIGSSAVQGRQVFGAIVTKPVTIQVKTFV